MSQDLLLNRTACLWAVGSAVWVGGLEAAPSINTTGGSTKSEITPARAPPVGSLAKELRCRLRRQRLQ